MATTVKERRNPLTLRSVEPVALATTASETTLLSYNYELIAEEHRATVQLAARRIKTKAERAKQDLLAIGQELVNVKERLAHGQFTEWIEQEFGMSLRMAQRMMNVWQVYGGKSDTVSLLSDSSLYLLAAPNTPEAARQEMEAQAQHTGKSPTRQEVTAAIARHRPQPQRTADTCARQSPRARQPTATTECPVDGRCPSMKPAP
jgi:hypothetical protein